MLFIKRLRANMAWGFAFGVVFVEWHQPRRIGLIVAAACASIVLNSLFDVANARWPKPLRWRLRRRRSPNGGTV